MKEAVGKLHCPNSSCAYHSSSVVQGFCFYIRRGSFKLKRTHQPIPRYVCRGCGRGFSTRTFKSTYKQKRPDLNQKIFRLYCSGMTQRRIAEEVGCNLKTVVRKFLFMSEQASRYHKQELERACNKLEHVQFDEMETFEHTRLKPLSIALAVSGDGKRIIDAKVGVLQYKGRLAEVAMRKYGYREDTSHKAREKVLESIKCVALTNLKVVTDAKPSYCTQVKEHLPHCLHEAVPNRRNQLQHATNPTRRRNIEDPLFALNHVAARIRHDMSRMMRKVWTTSKRTYRLQAHLNLYIAYFNQYPL